MCQAHVKSQIHFFLNFFELKIWIGYLPFFREIMTPMDTGTLPIQFLLKNYLHVKTTILAQKLWILEFFGGGGRKK